MKKHKCFKCHKSIEHQSIYGLHTDCFQKWFAVQDSSEFYDLDFKKTTSYSSSHSATFTTNKDSFYHGRYRKYSAKLGDQQYILKVEEPGFPDLPAMEYLCNQIASLLNLKVPEYYLILFSDESNTKNKATTTKMNKEEQESEKLITFVTKNFMQGTVGSLHHLYKYVPKSHYNCETLIKVIQEKTSRLRDVETFVEICLFDSFIGNGDRHGRNLGIIDTGKKRQLAPMYDNPSNFGVQDEKMLGPQFNFSGYIWTSNSKEPKTNDYLKEFKRLNLETACLKFAKKVIRQFPLLMEEIKLSEISEKRKKSFVNYLKNRLEDLKKLKKRGNS